MRQRRITIGGVERDLPAAHAARFEVVRSILVGELTLPKGAKRLRIRQAELERLVAGARQAVIDQLGEAALTAAQRRS